MMGRERPQKKKGPVRTFYSFYNLCLILPTIAERVDEEIHLRKFEFRDSQMMFSMEAIK